MIVVRDIFQLEFGAKGAADLFRQVIAINHKHGYGQASSRLLTDLAGGPYYTIVLETTCESLTDFERAIKEILKDPAFRAVYDKIVPLTESGRREVLTVLA